MSTRIRRRVRARSVPVEVCVVRTGLRVCAVRATWAPVRKPTSELGSHGDNIASMAWNRHAIEQTQLRKARRVDGVQSPRHRADAATEGTSRRWRGAPEIRSPLRWAPRARTAALLTTRATRVAIEGRASTRAPASRRAPATRGSAARRANWSAAAARTTAGACMMTTLALDVIATGTTPARSASLTVLPCVEINQCVGCTILH